MAPSRSQFLDLDSDNSEKESPTEEVEDSGDDLTSDELQSRFVDVLSHYATTKEMTPINVCHSMLRTRLPLLRLKRCRVARSTIPGAGLGLFATRDIRSGELITCFPGDALLLWSKSVGDFSGDVGVMLGPHVDADTVDVKELTSDAARSYEVKIEELESLVADPTRIDDAAYVGHMANDKAMLTKPNKRSRRAYSRSTEAGHNAAFFDVSGCHLGTTATKKIAKDEEIFVSYGEGYWMSRIDNAQSA